MTIFAYGSFAGLECFVSAKRSKSEMPSHRSKHLVFACVDQFFAVHAVHIFRCHPLRDTSPMYHTSAPPMSATLD